MHKGGDYVCLSRAPFCGRVHDRKFDCGKRPVYQRYNKTANDAARYTDAWERKAIDIADVFVAQT